MWCFVRLWALVVVALQCHVGIVWCSSSFSLQYSPSVHYPTEVAGSEVINLNPPSSGQSGGPVLAYTSNLRMDDDNTSVVQNLYFLADKAPSNLWRSQFSVKGGPNTFWIWDDATIQHPMLGPFISFDVVGNNFVGIALPSNSSFSTKGIVIQSIYNGTKPPLVSQINDGLNGRYNLISTYISPGNSVERFVYFAGWDTDMSQNLGNFVVVRGIIKLGSAVVTIFWPEDVLHIKLSCFDQFGVRSSPKFSWIGGMNGGGYLIVAIPGICTTFVKIIPYPDSFSQSNFTLSNPKNSPTQYVSSVAIDTHFNLIYYTLKVFRSNDTFLNSVNTDNFSLTPLNVSLGNEFKESDAMIVVGNAKINEGGGPYNWLFLIAQGSNKMIRLKIENNIETNRYYASLDSSFNKISSALYFSPYLYFVTYEPDAKLGRIQITNFCPSYCTENGYCSQVICVCKSGFNDDPHHKDGCIPSSQANLEQLELQEDTATVVLSVLFGLSVLSLISGWGCWWRSKKGEYSAV